MSNFLLELRQANNIRVDHVKRQFGTDLTLGFCTWQLIQNANS